MPRNLATAILRTASPGQSAIDAENGVIRGVKLMELGKVARFAGEDGKPKQVKITERHIDAAEALDERLFALVHALLSVPQRSLGDAHVVDEPLADGETIGMRVVEAGGVTVVLVSRAAGDSVARYLDRHGSGVQHIAIEVLNAGYARRTLAALDAPLLTDVVVDANGLEQFFTVQDPASGVQLGFIARTGHRIGFGAANVYALFDSLE